MTAPPAAVAHDMRVRQIGEAALSLPEPARRGVSSYCTQSKGVFTSLTTSLVELVFGLLSSLPRSGVFVQLEHPLCSLR